MDYRAFIYSIREIHKNEEFCFPYNFKMYNSIEDEEIIYKEHLKNNFETHL